MKGVRFSTFQIDSNPEQDELLSCDILMNSTTSIQEEKSKLQEQNQVFLSLKQYIDQVSQISTRIPDKVVDFLSSYLVCLRKNCTIETLRLLPLQDLISILEKCSKSHARLCKRGIVEIEDAILAIYLLEDSLSSQWGIGLIGKWGIGLNGQSNLDSVDSVGSLGSLGSVYAADAVGSVYAVDVVGSVDAVDAVGSVDAGSNKLKDLEETVEESDCKESDCNLLESFAEKLYSIIFSRNE